MGEYWKSTPKYWCKHCSTYVKDTKFERTNHEATAKHQGSLKRFLRELHRGSEREEREKQRAKDEVARLNGISSAPAGSKSSDPVRSTATGQKQKLSAEDRKRQMAQLAEMGIAMPEEYRRDMAMASDWQTVSTRPVYVEQEVVKEDEDDDRKSAALSMDLKKRKASDGDEEEMEAGRVKSRRHAWGSKIKTCPGPNDEDNDLDALLGSTRVLPKKALAETRSDARNGTDETSNDDVSQDQQVHIKQEESAEEAGASKDAKDVAVSTTDFPINVEEDVETPVFKKRKAKATKPLG